MGPGCTTASGVGARGQARPLPQLAPGGCPRPVAAPCARGAPGRRHLRDQPRARPPPGVHALRRPPAGRQDGDRALRGPPAARACRRGARRRPYGRAGPRRPATGARPDDGGRQRRGPGRGGRRLSRRGRAGGRQLDAQLPAGEPLHAHHAGPPLESPSREGRDRRDASRAHADLRGRPGAGPGAGPHRRRGPRRQQRALAAGRPGSPGSGRRRLRDGRERLTRLSRTPRRSEACLAPVWLISGHTLILADMPPDEVVGPVDARLVPRYAGPSTFARLPQADRVEKADVAILGVPFDAGTSYRPGARFGPEAVRQASRLLRTAYDPVLDAEPFRSQQVVDAGDVSANPYSIPEALGAIERETSRLLASGATVVTIGGDHTITLGALR